METSSGGREDYSRKSQRLAILSACCGALSVVMIQDSAVIILFAGMLGAGNMLSMITTSLFGVMNCLLLLPAAYFVARVGYKRSIIKTAQLGALAVLALAFSPLLGAFAKYGMIISLICFGMLITIYVAAWFPFLDEFLPKNDRSRFFGMLRFSWQSCCVGFFFIVGLIIGKTPVLWVLQTIIIITALALLGRAYYISKIAVSEIERKPLKFRYGLKLVLANKPLSDFQSIWHFYTLQCRGQCH